MDKEVKKAIALKFSSKIRRLREKHGLDMSALADILNISYGYMKQIEAGTYLPSLAVLYDAAKHFNVGLDYFIFNDEASQSRQQVLDSISIILNGFDDNSLVNVEKAIRGIKELFY